MAQNHRDDVTFDTFAPRVGSFDVQEFLSYIQDDGYESLTVKAVVFMIKDKASAASIAAKTICDPKSSEVLHNILMGGTFRPGTEKKNLGMKRSTFLENYVVAKAKRTINTFSNKQLLGGKTKNDNFF